MDVVVCTADRCECATLTTLVQQADATGIPAANTAELLDRWSDYAADGIVLALPPDAAVNTVQRVRRAAVVPLIVITDIHAEAEQVALYDAGASLVLPRPFSARLLVCHLRAWFQAGHSTPAADDLHAGDLVLDVANRMVQRASRPLPRLTGFECRLLHSLMRQRGQTLPADLLVERVWEYTSDGDRNALRKAVNRLRAKIEPNPRQPRYVVTVPGIGYRFAPDARCEDE